jgi:hypothetical protein
MPCHKPLVRGHFHLSTLVMQHLRKHIDDGHRGRRNPRTKQNLEKRTPNASTHNPGRGIRRHKPMHREAAPSYLERRSARAELQRIVQPRGHHSSCVQRKTDFGHHSAAWILFGQRSHRCRFVLWFTTTSGTTFRSRRDLWECTFLLFSVLD